MRIKREDQKKFQIFLFLISTFLIIFLAISNLRIETKRRDLNKEIEKLQTELQILEKRNEELKKAISKAKSESYWEEKAREEGYVKEGEEAIVIKKIREQEEKEEKSETIWQRIINFFQK
mgnify:CR=1 FL=1